VNCDGPVATGRIGIAYPERRVDRVADKWSKKKNTIIYSERNHQRQNVCFVVIHFSTENGGVGEDISSNGPTQNVLTLLTENHFKLKYREIYMYIKY